MLSSPALLSEQHQLDVFDSGEPALDDWLKKHARINLTSGASRTFVTCEANRVVGYYSLASSCLLHTFVNSRMRRNMPDPIPMVLLGRLAVDKNWHKQHIGTDLLKDAVIRVACAAETIGIRGIVVHAISDRARAFYIERGFTASVREPMTLFAPLDGIRAALAG